MPQTNITYHYLVALFLSEAMRSRRTSIKRAAEISRRVVRVLGTLESEEQMLKLVTELEREFEEVVALKQALHFSMEADGIAAYEYEIKEYASEMFKRDMAQTAAFLQDAAMPGTNIQQLCIKYPEFCSFVIHNSSKVPALAS